MPPDLSVSQQSGLTIVQETRIIPTGLQRATIFGSGRSLIHPVSALHLMIVDGLWTIPDVATLAGIAAKPGFIGPRVMGAKR
jgi:hypothetical protein